jgi:hypothetical protein
MLNRLVLAAACVWCLAISPASADVPATLILRSGERISGDLVDLNASGLSIRVNGKSRSVRVAEVAVIQFVDPGQLSGEAQGKAAAGQQFVVLRAGGTADGRLVDVGGTSPLRLTLEGPSGVKRNPGVSCVTAQRFRPAADSSGWRDAGCCHARSESVRGPRESVVDIDQSDFSGR